MLPSEYIEKGWCTLDHVKYNKDHEPYAWCMVGAIEESRRQKYITRDQEKLIVNEIYTHISIGKFIEFLFPKKLILNLFNDGSHKSEIMHIMQKAELKIGLRKRTPTKSVYNNYDDLFNSKSQINIPDTILR